MDLRREEEIEKDVFLMECAQDITIRDQMSILQRSFQTRNQVYFMFIQEWVCFFTCI